MPMPARGSRGECRKPRAIAGPAHADGHAGRAPKPVNFSEHLVDQAFDFFDVCGKGTLTPADLKARLSIFYPDLPEKEYHMLISEPNFNKQACLPRSMYAQCIWRLLAMRSWLIQLSLPARTSDSA